MQVTVQQPFTQAHHVPSSATSPLPRVRLTLPAGIEGGQTSGHVHWKSEPSGALRVRVLCPQNPSQQWCQKTAPCVYTVFGASMCILLLSHSRSMFSIRNLTLYKNNSVSTGQQQNTSTHYILSIDSAAARSLFPYTSGK